MSLDLHIIHGVIQYCHQIRTGSSVVERLFYTQLVGGSSPSPCIGPDVRTLRIRLFLFIVRFFGGECYAGGGVRAGLFRVARRWSRRRMPRRMMGKMVALRRPSLRSPPPMSEM